MINREVRLPLHVILSQVNDKDNANEDMEEENATLRKQQKIQGLHKNNAN